MHVEALYRDNGTVWGQMTCADESWPRDMLGRAGHPSQCYDALAAGQKCRQRVSEMLEPVYDL